MTAAGGQHVTTVNGIWPDREHRRRADAPDGGPAVVDVTPQATQYTRLEDACAVEYPRLARLLTLYCGDRETAQDLAQETLARGCVHWAALSRMEQQSAWFTRVALNLAASRWRRLVVERRFTATLARRERPLGVPDVVDAVAVRSAVSALTPRQRAAVVLRFFDDLDLATTAAVMRCSEGTVKKLTARGLAALRGSLGVEFDLHRGGRDD
jgi:RNA polymerase sigma factor (sigma-70 family)